MTGGENRYKSLMSCHCDMCHSAKLKIFIRLLNKVVIWPTINWHHIRFGKHISLMKLFPIFVMSINVQYIFSLHFVLRLSKLTLLYCRSVKDGVNRKNFPSCPFAYFLFCFLRWLIYFTIVSVFFQMAHYTAILDNNLFFNPCSNVSLSLAFHLDLCWQIIAYFPVT